MALFKKQYFELGAFVVGRLHDRAGLEAIVVIKKFPDDVMVF